MFFTNRVVRGHRWGEGGDGVGGGGKMPVISLLLRKELIRCKKNRAFAIKFAFNENVQKILEILIPNFQQLRLGGRREGEVASYPRKMLG